MPLTDTGEQHVIGIIGDPVIQVKSPAIFADFFQARGINAVMVPLQVASSNFQMALEGLRTIKNFGGAIITIPHKHEAYKLAGKKSLMVEDTEMANVLVPVGDKQWCAGMFDGLGLINALKKRKITTAGLRVLVIGAGGAGTAIAVALQQLGQVVSLDIADVDRQKAEQLVTKIKNGKIVEPNPENYQMIINATPVGMRSDEIPADTSLISPGTVVCDAVMDPPKTRFLQEAEQNDCIIVEGKEMLLGQVEPIARFLGF